MEAGDQRPGISVGSTSRAWTRRWLHLLCLLLPKFSAQIPITCCSLGAPAERSCGRWREDTMGLFSREWVTRVGHSHGECSVHGAHMLFSPCTISTSVLSLFMRVCQVSVQPNAFYPHNFFCKLQAIGFENSTYHACPALPWKMVQSVKARLTSKMWHLTLSER